MNEQAPKLPEPRIKRGYAWKVPIAKYDYYTAEQVLQAVKEAQERMAVIADEHAKTVQRLAADNDGRLSDFAFGAGNAANDIADAIRNAPYPEVTP